VIREQLGLIGIGLLGTALASRFAEVGFTVIGYDVSAERLKALMELGGEATGSAAQVAQRCARLVICLPHSRVTSSVLQEIEPHFRAGALVVDMTTGAPDEMEQFGRRLAERGLRYLDATVAGSSRQVLAGEAIVMAGCDDGAWYEAAREILSSFAAKSFHVGPCGAGARMKLIVNLVLGLNRAVVAEGLAFAEACGVDGELALELLKASPAYSRAMDTKGTKMLRRDYKPEARLRQHHKDVRLILSEGERSGARLPLSWLHDQLLSEAESAGYAEADNSAIIEVLRSTGSRKIAE
jgi:3-hydroxyisobutyrate dehydrogenase-like beta-hydroxyacid dehydrogenase